VNDQELNDLLKALDNPHHGYPPRLVDAIRLLVKRRDEAMRDSHLQGQVAEAIKVALRMPGTGSYVEYARWLREEHDRLCAERDEARRLLKAVVDITLDNMAPDATHPKHQCDFVHRPDIAMCKVCKNWTEALATIYPDDFQDEEDGK
jgi:hypothetical protein